MLLAVLALLKAAGYWLQRYELTASTRGAVDGATYTDVNAQLPAIELLALISLLAAVLLIVNVWQRGWRLPVIAVGPVGARGGDRRHRLPGRSCSGSRCSRPSRREEPYIASATSRSPARRFSLDDVQVRTIRVDDLTAPEGTAGQDAIADSSGCSTRTSSRSTFQRLQELAGLLPVQRPRRRPLPDRRPAAAGRAGRPELNRADSRWTPGRARTSPTPTATAWPLRPASEVRSDGSPDFLRPVRRGRHRARRSTEPAIYFGEGLHELRRGGRPSASEISTTARHGPRATRASGGVA